MKLTPRHLQASAQRQHTTHLASNSSTGSIFPTPAATRPTVVLSSSPTTQQHLSGRAAVIAHATQQPPARAAQGYAASPSDTGVLKLPSRAELDAAMITHVFGFPRDLRSKYHVGMVIGAGSFGVVRECVDKATGEKWAVKTINKTPKRGKPTPRYLLKLRNEVEIMQQLGFSLDAVTLKDVFEDNEHIHLVMELCEGGALLERIESRNYSENYIAGLIRCILRFISQCHAKGIIYRDVKPDNFLFLSEDDDTKLRATDFGLSIRHRPDQEKMFSRSGTPAYMAPELVQQKYDCKCDVWSVGMMAYQLLTGKFPFWSDVRLATLSDVWQAILYDPINWKAPEVRALSPQAVNFLQTLLKRDPAHRPNAQQALQHPWLQEQGPGGELPLGGSVVQRLQRFSTYGRLKQLALKMIVDQLHEDKQTGDGIPEGNTIMVGLEELFARLDTDSSGGISLQELTAGLKSQGYRLDMSEVDHLVQGIDLNHDRDIQLPEFITTMLDWNILQAKQDWQVLLDRVYRKLDLDGDGYIDLEELTTMLRNSISAAKQWNADEQLAVAKLMLREADTNCDGRISKEEFMDLMMVDHVPDNLSVYDDRLEPDAAS